MLRKVEITTKTLLTTTGFFIILWFLFVVRDILVSLFVAVIVVSAVHPLVERLTRLRIPRSLSILLVYGTILLGIGALGSIIVPPLVDQSLKLLSNIPQYVIAVREQFGVSEQLIDPTFLQNQVAPLSSNLVSLSVGLFSDIVGIITLGVFTFYLLLERTKLESYLARLIAPTHHEQVDTLIRTIEERLGAWVRGELTLMTIIGVLVYIGLRVLGVEFALPLAIVAGLLEIVPVVGPIVSAIPAILIALTASPILALAVGALYFLVQQLENNIIVPKVMERAVGIHPLLTILGLMIGGKLMGVVGALLAVPMVVVAQTILTDVLKKRHSTT